MASVLTTASVVQCPHLAPFTLTSAALLRVGGHPVVRSIDIVGAVVTCPASSPCVKITEFQTSAILQDGSFPVVLGEGLKTINGSCRVEAAHDLLNAE